MMENLNDLNEKRTYKVFDEMAFETVLITDDFILADNLAFNRQILLIDYTTNEIIRDYSC